MYRLKGFIFSVTIISLLDLNNMGLGGPTVRGLSRWILSPVLARFIKIQARPTGCPAHAEL